MSERQTTAEALTPDEIGSMILGVPDILGWERHLLLCDLQHGDEKTYLGFRWNDSLDASNTKRGQFAIGIHVSTDLPLGVRR